MKCSVARWCCILCVGLLAASAGARPPGRTDAEQDIYLRGYVESLLRNQLLLAPGRVRVDGGVITVDASGLGTFERRRLDDEFSRIPGVKGVKLVYDERDLPPSFVTPPGDAADQRDQDLPSTLLTPARLFDPLLADPRWPHFFATYQRSVGDDPQFHNVGSVGFGETISVYRRNLPAEVRFEAAIQAGVFAIFDLGSNSFDLVNADYFVGPTAAFRKGDLSALLRLYHQSSHLGDEFLLRGGVDRVNVSYEAVDALLSYEFLNGFRAYGGFGYLIHVEPEGIDRGMIHYGLEYTSPVTLDQRGFVRPLAAADLQHRDETGWNLDASVRGGIEVADPSRYVNRMQLLVEYYDGYSPNGQFFDDRVRTLGLGLHFYF